MSEPLPSSFLALAGVRDLQKPAHAGIEAFLERFAVETVKRLPFRRVATRELTSGSELDFFVHDADRRVRAFRPRDRPFFFGTRFQPERMVLGGSLHPLVRAFFSAEAEGAKAPAP